MATSRKALARELGVSAESMRLWEKTGLLPRFGSVPLRFYRDRVILIAAARERLSLQAVRAALAVGGA